MWCNFIPPIFIKKMAKLKNMGWTEHVDKLAIFEKKNSERKSMPKDIYSGTSVHERPCSHTIRFTNNFFEQKVSDDERCLGLRTSKLATAAS
jgi:hypothetical protein